MERRRDIVILYRSVYQRSSDFESRHLRLRTISLRPYKDSVSMPFSQCPHKSQSTASFPLLLSPKDTSPPAPISPPPYSTNKTPQIPTPLPPSLPPNSHPQAPVLLSPHAPQSPYLAHQPLIYFAVLQRVHFEYQPPQEPPHPTAYREPYEALSMLGVVYTCVHSCVHACTVIMYTRVYNRAFIPISF